MVAQQGGNERETMIEREFGRGLDGEGQVMRIERRPHIPFRQKID